MTARLGGAPFRMEPLPSLANTPTEFTPVEHDPEKCEAVSEKIMLK